MRRLLYLALLYKSKSVLWSNYCFIGNIKSEWGQMPPQYFPLNVCSGTKVNGHRAHSWEIELGGLAPSTVWAHELARDWTTTIGFTLWLFKPAAGSIPHTFDISRFILQGFSIIASTIHNCDLIHIRPRSHDLHDMTVRLMKMLTVELSLDHQS